MLIQNAIYCPQCCTFLVSTHVHDYVSCRHGFMVDGGLEYSRGSRSPDEINDYVIPEGASRDVLKSKLLWGSYGIHGGRVLIRRPLKDLDTDHLYAILSTQSSLSPLYKSIIEELLEERSN